MRYRWHVASSSVGIIPDQVPRVTTIIKEEICNATSVLGGSYGKQAAKMEGISNAKEWPANFGSIRALRHANSCDGGFGPAHENDCSNEQGV